MIFNNNNINNNNKLKSAEVTESPSGYSLSGVGLKLLMREMS